MAEARAIQEALRSRVIARDRSGRVRHVAGVDASYDRTAGVTRAAVAVLAFPGLERVSQRVVERRTRFPYVPGYLSFRETPALLAALAGLRRRPDLILCDGQGLAHPRRFGLACHLGVLLDAIGLQQQIVDPVVAHLLDQAHGPPPSSCLPPSGA